ncbi:MAG: AgmX/PglI C-terminal domain-containing protein [Moraxellaceae bacterium]|nr:AgmX/PglI C-terminal domain-containing protein [Pseudobdellovibrionaceae bacterium]
MEKNLVLEDNTGAVVRVFNWSGNDATVIRRADTKRIEISDNLEYYFDNNIDFVELGQVSGETFEAVGNEITAATTGKSRELALGTYGRLTVVPQIQTHQKNVEAEEDKNRLWMLCLLLVLLFTMTGTYLMRFAPTTSAKIEEDLKQQVVKIVKHIKKETPPVQKMIKPTEEKVEPAQTKISPTKIAGLKRMGALSVLGSLKTGKNKGGLDMSAAESTAGPGMGGTEGSGGVQTSLYAKGITSAALGAGHNVNGGGGYGTKGKGGGQAGYGKMALTGSSGATPIPLGNEANVAQGLDRDQIAAVINRNIGQVTYCYEQGLKDTPGIRGRIAIAFVIGGTGSVKSANVDSTSLNAKSVEDCIVMRLKTWKFPVPEGGVDVQVKYPFKLERTGEG